MCFLVVVVIVSAIGVVPVITPVIMTGAGMVVRLGVARGGRSTVGEGCGCCWGRNGTAASCGVV